jgi:hypothetical protein
VGQQAPANDRSVGVPGIYHGERFADMRARSKAFDEARARSVRRKKKAPEQIMPSDFAVGDLVEVRYCYPNGRTLPGRAIVEDVNPLKKGWRQDGTVYVRWITEDQEQTGHLFSMYLPEHGGYVWRGQVRWVNG